jgi:UDP-2,3-diacylglucosamine pyrophosphatase LpxH
MTTARSVYVISDLHIGGNYPDANAPHEERRRGFRMMTRVKELEAFIRQLARLPADPPVELVINGDFIDFLAEEKGSGCKEEKGARRKIDPAEPPAWTPFRAQPGEALDAFHELVRRDRVLFDALRDLLAEGKTLTILLGNHDIELCLPDVRAALETTLGPGTLRFLDDGQALDLGEVLVDHGNLFDPANVVDHGRLRVLRSAYSRGWFKDLDKVFSPPAGSKLVARVMNPIKVAYGFIDLLKPESEPLLALLLALEPSYRNVFEDTAAALASAVKTLVPRTDVPWALRNATGTQGADASTSGLRNAAGGPATPAAAAFDALVAEVLAADPEAAAALEAAETLQAAAKEAGGLQEASGGFRAKWSLFRMLIRDEEGDVASRIPLVQATLRALKKDHSFDRGEESDRYLDAAKWLATQGPHQKGYKAVVFGHTHHAKSLRIPDTNARYLNTGTWANLMRFPDLFTSKDATRDQVRDALIAFAKKLKANDLAEYLHFEPTYVRLDLGASGELISAELRDYDWKADKL